MSHSSVTSEPRLGVGLTSSERHEQIARPDVRLGVVVLIACMAQFMIILQESVVNVALPAMRTALGLSTSGQQWVVDGYLITFGGFLLLAARAGDLFGHKRVLQIGLVIFTVGGLAGGFARSGGWLISACVVQGVGAAALAPASLSLITATHPEGPIRTRALSIWSAVAGAAAPLGLVVGGVLTSDLSWRYTLFANVPIAVAMLVAVTLVLRSTRGQSAASRLDLPGSASVTAGVAALVFGISEAQAKGWGSALVLLSLAAAVVLLTAFVIIESRVASPLVPLTIFRNRSLNVANAAIACVGVSLTAQLFFVSLYLQQVTHYSALRTGVAMIPMSAAMIVASISAQRLIPRLGARTVMIFGALVGTAGLVWLSRLPVKSDYLSHVAIPTALLGLGIGLMVLPVAEAATAGVHPEQAGLASGLFNVTRQIGGAIGLAALVTVATTTTKHTHLTSVAAATTHGYRAALLVCAVVNLAAAFIGVLLPPVPPVGSTTPGLVDSKE